MSTTPRTDAAALMGSRELEQEGKRLETELTQTKLALESVNRDCTILEDSYKRAMAIGLEQKAKIKELSKWSQCAVDRWYHGIKDTLYDSHDIAEGITKAIAQETK